MQKNRNEIIAAVGILQSPCVRNCCLDDDDICLGCYRSLPEILAWGAAGEQERREILARSRARCEQRRGRSPGGGA